jgi:hypothetical protein
VANDRLAAHFADPVGRFFGRGSVHIDACHARAFFGQESADRSPNAAAGARHDGGFINQFLHADR